MAVELERIERVHLGLIGAASCAGWATGWMGPGSVALGGGVMAANVWLLKTISRRVLTPGASERPGVVLLLVLAKFSIFLALLGIMFWRMPLDPMAFAAGASLLMVACLWAAMMSGSEDSSQQSG